MFCKKCGSEVPEGIAFCAACGTSVSGNAAAKSDKSGMIKLVAIVAVIAVVLGLFIGLIGGGSPKSVAKKYIQAEIEGNMKKTFALSAGKMKKMFEKETKTEQQDMMFEGAEKAAEELDLKVKVNNFNQYYKATKKIAKANLKETFGKNYKIDVKVLEVKDIRTTELEAIQKRYDNDQYEDYIKADKIKKGKYVAVSVMIEGSEDRQTIDYVVSVVKYGGKWKVVGARAGKLD